jgi:hypothetical protein
MPSPSGAVTLSAVQKENFGPGLSGFVTAQVLTLEGGRMDYIGQ